MEYNPYARKYAILNQEYQSAKSEEARLVGKVRWYDGIDSESILKKIDFAAREIQSLHQSLRTLEFSEKRRSFTADKLRRETGLSFNLLYLFSSERSAKKRELLAHEQTLVEIARQKSDLDRIIPDKFKEIGAMKAELNHYRSFNRLEADANLKALALRMNQLAQEIELLAPKKNQVDLQMKEPLGELAQLEVRKDKIVRELHRAENLERKLSSSSDGHQRRMVHVECSNAFGESRPARVITVKSKELESLNRNIDKVQVRLKSIAQRASRVVKAVVIDGNNLCYQHQIFIGLVALLAVARRLSPQYTVMIVFDAVIRRRVHMSDKEIAIVFGDHARVHVVATEHQADETLLDAASSEATYVISNDRFGDFQEKPVVREGRLIRHEILNNRVLIHDLDVNEEFNVAP